MSENWVAEDITFCPAELCANVKCYRNKANIRDKTMPHSFYVAIPKECPDGKYRSEIRDRQFKGYRKKR